jgi:hypothetical protein
LTQRRVVGRVVRAAVLACFCVVVIAACGGTHRSGTTSTIPRKLLQEARPIGIGPRFHPAATGPVLGKCKPRLGARFGAHVEVFAANRVVLLPAGIGTAPPRTWSGGRLSPARCYGDLVTLDPTGLVYVRQGRRLSLSALFRAWGQSLSSTHMASFAASAGRRVTVFVDGRRWRGRPESVPLSRHAEIVAEVGPLVPPHASYSFPPGS